MKVLLVNGSPHEHGCTDRALQETAYVFKEEGIETEIFWIGNGSIGGCTACGACSKLGRCVIDDNVNLFTVKAQEADGFIFGSPVYYSGMNGSMKSFMDRAFFSGHHRDPNPYNFKPAAAVTSARRAGTTPTLEQMNQYFLHGQMVVIGSRYWNMVHGFRPEQVEQDEEGLQVMHVLARNMSWFLKLKEAGEAAGITPPQQEKRKQTNFIR